MAAWIKPRDKIQLAPESGSVPSFRRGASLSRRLLLLPTLLLIADDDEIVREVVTEQLEAAGYAVLAASNGAAALAVLDMGEVVDLLVSDLSMPGMDGVALVREAQRRRPRLPAILPTGFATNAAEIAVGGAVGGAFTLLRKPVEGKVLAERMAVLLEGVAVGGDAD